MKIYLSGPMSGYPQFNSIEFKRYADHYRARGWTVFSPPETDDGDWTKPYAYYIKRDILALVEQGVERIYLLPNWHMSKGALLEKHIGEVIGLEIWDAVTNLPWEESTVQEAHRLVHGPRGVAYGHPLDDMGRTAGMLNALLSDVLRWELNARDVWQIMACVKLSRERNAPKRDNRVDLGGYAETGEMIEDEAKRRGIALSKRTPTSTKDTREDSGGPICERATDPARKEDTQVATEGARFTPTNQRETAVPGEQGTCQCAEQRLSEKSPCTCRPEDTCIPFAKSSILPA
jgi:hypothetical protein